MLHQECTLITPERIATGQFPHHWKEPLPKSIRWWFGCDEIPDPTSRPLAVVTVVAGSGSNKARWSSAIMHVVQFAILCEVARFGHTIAPNGNGNRDGLLPERFYWRVTYKGAPNDKTTVNRLWKDAGAYQEVIPGRVFGDQRSDSLQLVEAWRADKSAREICLKHCERLAIERGAGAAYLKAYIGNLQALFDLLDGSQQSADVMEAAQ